MRRRQFIATTTTTLPIILAGCNGPKRVPKQVVDGPDGETGAQLRVAQLRMRPGDDGDIGTHFARVPSRYRDPPKRGLVISRTIENGLTSIDGERPPARGEKPVIYEEGVYRISYEIADERPATRYFWQFEPPDDGRDDETVRFEDLPELDRKRFRWAGLADGADGESGVTGGAFKYANEERETSALVPAPDRPIIVWGSDRRARFTVTEKNDEDATLKTYRYRPEQLASSVEAYGQQLREQHAFELSGLSDAERDIVEQATQNNGFAVTADEQVPDAFESIADRFSEQEAIESYIGGNASDYLSRYEGQVHTTRLVNRDDRGTKKTVSGE